MKTITKLVCNFLYFYISYFCILYLLQFIFGQRDILFSSLLAALIFATLMTVITAFFKNNNAVLNIYNRFFKKNIDK